MCVCPIEKQARKLWDLLEKKQAKGDFSHTFGALDPVQVNVVDGAMSFDTARDSTGSWGALKLALGVVGHLPRQQKQSSFSAALAINRG